MGTTLVTLWMDAVWQSTLVAIAALVAARAARRAPAAIRQAILAVALLKFLTPPVAILPGLFALVPRPETAAVERSVIATAAPVDGSSWTPWLAAAYLAGAAIVAGFVLLSIVRTWRLRRAAQTASDDTRHLAVTLAERIGVRRRVQIAVSDAFSAPMAVGVFRPAVLVPRRLEASLDPSELRAVIGHELAHHRRGDLLWAWLRSAACTAWWWHPAVWNVSRALRHVQEESCDD